MKTTSPLSLHSSVSCVKLFQYAAAAVGRCEFSMDTLDRVVNMWVLLNRPG